MRVIIENELDGFVHKSIVESNGVTASEVLDECLRCMLGLSFAEVSIKDAVLGKAEDYEEEKNPS